MARSADQISTPVTSWLMGPPAIPNRAVSLLVRSGLITSHDCPSFRLRCTTFEP